MDSKMFQFLAITTTSHVLKSIKRAMIKSCCQVPKPFAKRKLQVVNTKTNRPIHPQPTSSKTYKPYAVLVPFTSVFLLELTVNTCRKKERPPTTVVAILNLRARSCGHASTNQTFFTSELTRPPDVRTYGRTVTWLYDTTKISPIDRLPSGGSRAPWEGVMNSPLGWCLAIVTSRREKRASLPSLQKWRWQLC